MFQRRTFQKFSLNGLLGVFLGRLERSRDTFCSAFLQILQTNRQALFLDTFLGCLRTWNRVIRLLVCSSFLRRRGGLLLHASHAALTPQRVGQKPMGEKRQGDIEDDGDDAKRLKPDDEVGRLASSPSSSISP